jgi:hypothetical protein
MKEIKVYLNIDGLNTLDLFLLDDCIEIKDNHCIFICNETTFNLWLKETASEIIENKIKDAMIGYGCTGLTYGFIEQINE